MVSELVRFNKAIVDTRPGSPKQWSPCRWLMKMWFSRMSLSFMRRTASCAPSPQSIIIRLSRPFSTWHDGWCRGVIVALPHPNMFNSSRVIGSSDVTIEADGALSRLLYRFTWSVTVCKVSYKMWINKMYACFPTNVHFKP